MFWAELYANFGDIAVFIVPLLLGIIFYIIQRKLTKLSQNPVKVALIVWLSIRFSLITVRGASYLLADTDMFAVLLVAFILFKVERKRKTGRLNNMGWQANEVV